MPNPIDAGLAAINEATDHEKHGAMARGLLRGYDARWNDEPWQVEAVEEEFQTSIFNLATGRRSKTFSFAGKKDLRVTDPEARAWVVDHKTTSGEIRDPDAVYWRQLQVENQASAYLLSEHILGRKPFGAVWDVIKKPGIRPKKVAQKERAGIASLGTYCGFQVSDETKQWVIGGGDRENGELYEHRVARECLDKPLDYFQRKRIFRLGNQIEDYAHKLWDLSQEILLARRNDRHLTNDHACLEYGTPCQYLGICSGYDKPDRNKWQKRPQTHSELSIEDGANVLTHSRLATFLMCRRKHYYRYELGIERVNDKKSDALTFGTIMHAGLEAWCKAKQEEQNAPSSSDTD